LEEESIKKNHYTDSIFYEIELTAKYCKMLGTQFFDKINAGITPDEYIVLDTILTNPEICQRDIAKSILKDRANTGKILDSLEKKGYIERILTTKNNYPVRMAKLTELGHQKVKYISDTEKPYTDIVREKFEEMDVARIKTNLKKLREELKQILEIQI